MCPQSLPGADRIAIKTGAVVIANNEAINLLKEAGVPDGQLLPVQGGERIPLFTRATREKALSDPSMAAPGFPGAPKRPLPALAALSVDIWPSLHCLMPEDHPEVIDTGTVYKGSASPYSCSLDITMGMKYGLLNIEDLMPVDKRTPGHQSFIEYIKDRKRHVFSHADGGQLMFNIIIDGKAILWSAHLGGYEGVLRNLTPQPEIVIMAIAGRANLNGRPFDGSAAEFAAMKLDWLGKPSKVIWCLHDEAYVHDGLVKRRDPNADWSTCSCIPPWRIETTAATEAVEKNGKTKVLTMNQVDAITLGL